MVAAPAEVSGLVAEELQKNEQLRATLQSMGGATSPQVARPSPELEGKLKAIAVSAMRGDTQTQDPKLRRFILGI